MPATDPRQIFTAAANNAKDADTRARIELAREYFTDAAFRRALEDRVWAINSKAEA